MSESLSEEVLAVDVLAAIYPVMSKCGATCSPAEFHRSINLAFHRAESEVYDQIHRCMWESLPQQCQLLIQDYLGADAKFGNELVALDIGCGTGLASELLLNSEIGSRISQVDLLDTSREMLQKANARARKWSTSTRTLHGSVERLADSTRKYDIIIVCSVLHHIPDLAQFLERVRAAQAPAGIFLHLQDPNGDFLDDPVLEQRIAELRDAFAPVPKWLARWSPRRVIKAVYRKVSRRPSRDYVRQVNEELIAAGIMTKAMTPNDVWTVTDIHCLNGFGIRTDRIGRYLRDYQLVSRRSYGFFGKLSSELPERFKQEEEELIQRRAPNGVQVAGIWKMTK